MKNIAIILSAIVAVSLSMSVAHPPIEDDPSLLRNVADGEDEPNIYVDEPQEDPRDDGDHEVPVYSERDDLLVRMVSDENEIPMEFVTTAVVNQSISDGNVTDNLVDIDVVADATYNSSGRYTDCHHLYAVGVRLNGVYLIHPDRSSVAFQVYCDFHTTLHGWTVIMRRRDGEIFFYQNWESYRNGFGGLKQDHWLGLDFIRHLANQRPSVLRVDLYDCDGSHRFAEYDYFALGNPATNYELLLGLYSGDSGDSLSYHRYQQFSTYDHDNDESSSANCAAFYKGGWWYNDCYESNLNGLFLRCDQVPPGHTTIAWKTFHGFDYSMPRVEMKVRPL